MFDVVFSIVRSSFQIHFAHGYGCQCTGTPKPPHRKKVNCLACYFFRWFEGHVQTRFHLHDFIRKQLEFTRLFVMHVRHENAEFVFRESAKHLLDFWKMDCRLSSSQPLWQTTGASL